MSTYRITNITHRAGKRDNKFNSNLDIEYVDNMMRKKVVLKPGSFMYLTVGMLPLSIHRLRMKNLVIVEEIAASEIASLTKQPKLQPKPEAKPEVKSQPKLKPELTKVITKVEDIDDEEKKASKKRAIKKEEEVE